MYYYYIYKNIVCKGFFEGFFGGFFGGFLWGGFSGEFSQRVSLDGAKICPMAL